jgi:hypothetical protein
LLWDEISQYAISQAQKLHVPIKAFPHPDNAARSNQSQGPRIIIDSASPESTRINDYSLTIGLPISQANMQTIRQLIDDHLPIVAKKYHQNQKDQFKQLVLSGIEKRKSSLKNSIQQAGYSMDNLGRELFELSRKTELDRIILSKLEKPTTPIGKKLQSEYNRLKTLVPSLYTLIEFESNTIRTITHPVTIQFEGNDYEIGILTVEIDLSSGSIRITNLTNRANGYPHPHVNESGEVCLGNISSGLGRLFGEFEIYGALELLHKFVHTYNESDAYQKIQYWDDPDWCEDDDGYERCREGGSYGRGCLDCGDAECPYYEGALEECAEEPDFPKCVNCTERCHAGNNLLSDCHSENPLCCMTCTFSTCSYYRDSNSCHKANSKSCSNCNIDYCHFREVINETV